MENEDTNKQVNQLPDMAELMRRIHHSRARLEELVGSLSHEQLTYTGPSGWSIKDHLAHLATWELGVAELLHCRPRFAAMQVDEAVSQGKSEDEINDVIYNLHATLPVDVVMDMFRKSHQQMLAVLGTMDDEDLLKPYRSYAVEGVANPDRPVINWIIGNTCAHFDEHLGYIKKTLQDIGV